MSYDEHGKWIERPGRDWVNIIGALLIVAAPAGGTAAILYWLRELVQ